MKGQGSGCQFVKGLLNYMEGKLQLIVHQDRDRILLPISQGQFLLRKQAGIIGKMKKSGKRLYSREKHGF